MEITGAQLWVKALKEEGVDTLFAYPGGQAIDLFDALYGQTGIRLIVPRHEQGLVHAADGYARSTGKTGVCMVTSGPGATNMVTGIATANYDSVPLVCFAGQVPTRLLGNDAFQEVDLVGMTSGICKYAVTVRDRARLAETIKKAFLVARTARPGVVVVELPKDIQQAYGDDTYPAEITVRGCPPAGSASPGQLRAALDRLRHAERPLFLAGGGVHIAHAEPELTRLAERTGVPVVTTIMGKGAVPSSHPLYVGNLGIHGSYAAHTAVSRCDVLFAVGVRFNDRITGGPEAFAENACIIRLDIDASSVSRDVEVDLSITADAKQALGALLEQAGPLPADGWRNQIAEWKQAHPLAVHTPGLSPQAILSEINRAFPRVFFCTDVGQNQLWASQFLELDTDHRLLTSGGLGTMGYGLPAAVGAQLGNPGQPVVVITGDGGMQMNMQELVTAAVYGLPLIVCILNNGWLGNVRQWQEQFYGRRYAGTCMRRRNSCPPACDARQCPPYLPDFVRLAESCGAAGIRVTEAEQIPAALARARQNRKTPTVIEFLIAPECNVMPIVPPGGSLRDMALEGGVEKRWLCLFVENEAGVLARIAGLFSGKGYNLDSLTVGVTEDETISRMTIGLISDSCTYAQVKRQLERCVEVIRVVDYTGQEIYLREILFARVDGCTREEQDGLPRMAAAFGAEVLDSSGPSILLQHMRGGSGAFLDALRARFAGRLTIIRGGCVAAETLSASGS